MVALWLHRWHWSWLVLCGSTAGVALASPVPTTPPPSTEKPVFGTAAGPTETSDNFVVTWVDGEATSSEIGPLLQDLESAWEALVVDSEWPRPPSADVYRVWVIVDSSLDGLGITALEGSEVSVPVIRIHPDVLSETSVRRATTAHEFHHAIQLGIRDPVAEEDLWFSEASATWAEGQVWPQNSNRWDAAWGYMNQPGLPFDSPDMDHAQGMWLFVESLFQGGHSIPAIWDNGQSGEPWLSTIEESTGQSASVLWVDFTATVLSGVYGQPRLQGEVVDGASETLALLGTHYWVNPGPDAVGVEAFGYGGGQVIATNASGQMGGLLRVEPGRAVAVTGELPDAVYWLNVGEAPGKVGDHPGFNEDQTATTSGPSNVSVSGACSNSSNGMGTLWSWWMVAVSVLALKRQRPSADPVSTGW